MTDRHFLPADTPEAEARQDAVPVLLPVVDAPGPGLDRLWLGNLTAVEDPQAMDRAGATASLNLAINIFPGPLTLPDGSMVRRYQLGMIDGAGNAPEMLAAAVMLIDALAAGHMPGKPHYPPHRPGGLVVHCRGGRSRSVTVLALWLHLRRGADFPTLTAALDHMRGVRGLGGEHPLPPMIALAQQVLERGLVAR